MSDSLARNQRIGPETRPEQVCRERFRGLPFDPRWPRHDLARLRRRAILSYASSTGTHRFHNQYQELNPALETLDRASEWASEKGVSPLSETMICVLRQVGTNSNHSGTAFPTPTPATLDREK